MLPLLDASDDSGRESLSLSLLHALDGTVGVLKRYLSSQLFHSEKYAPKEWKPKRLEQILECSQFKIVKNHPETNEWISQMWSIIQWNIMQSEKRMKL